MRTFVVNALALTLTGASLSAQTLSGAVKELYSFGSGCAEQICLSVDAGTHLDHFNPSAAGAQAGLTTFLQQAIGASAANIPIAATTSTGILVQSGEGLPTRVSTSGGPIFAERMQTIGKHNWYFSFNATNFDYSTLRGVPLSELHSTITHQDTPPVGQLGNPNFENDVIEVSTSMHVQMTAFTGVATFGLFDHVDVGIAVPLLYSSLSGSSNALIMPSGVNDPHFFGDSAHPSLSATSHASASAAGVGDMVARVKVGILAKKEWGVAFLGDIRVPTGNTENFQGSGAWGFEGIGIVSAQFGQFSPHVNLGYTTHSGSTINDAVLATVGFDQKMADWATLAVDVLSSWQVGASTYDLPQPVTLTFYNNTTIPPTSRTIIPSNIPDQRDNTIVGSFGFKFLTRSGVTIVTNALVPMLRGGLQPGAAFTLGVDYTLY